MPLINVPVPEATAVLTANGSTAGVITVASTAGFYAGAEAWIVDDNSAPKRLRITKILGATTMQARAMLSQGGPDPIDQRNDQRNEVDYTLGSDLSAYTTGQNASVDMPAQVVRGLQAFDKVNLL